MPKLDLTPERHTLLLETVEETLGTAQQILDDLIDGDPVAETTDEMVALFDVQHERVVNLRELLEELQKG
jgi:hypothetical protein